MAAGNVSRQEVWAFSGKSKDSFRFLDHQGSRLGTSCCWSVEVWLSHRDLTASDKVGRMRGCSEISVDWANERVEHWISQCGHLANHKFPFSCGGPIARSEVQVTKFGLRANDQWPKWFLSPMIWQLEHVGKGPYAFAETRHLGDLEKKPDFCSVRWAPHIVAQTTKRMDATAVLGWFEEVALF